MNDETLREKTNRLAKVFGNVDRETLVVLKGHLLIEESLNSIIETFVHHAEKMQNAKLSFFQKVHIAKSMSLTEHESSAWILIEHINSLRNDFAHKLESEKRAAKIENLKKLYALECKDNEFTEDPTAEDNSLFIGDVVAFCLGFLGSFEAEVMRFKEIVQMMDNVLNKKKNCL